MSGSVGAADAHTGRPSSRKCAGAKGRTMMTSDNQVDPDIALRKLRELA